MSRCVVARTGVVSQAQHRPCHMPPRLYRGHVAACTRALLCAMSQLAAAVSPGVLRHTPVAKPLPSCHDTIVCIVTRFANQTARLSRYKDCIVTQPPAARPSLLLRYKTLYRDTHTQPSPTRARCRPCRGLPWPCRGLYRGLVDRIVAYPLRPGQPPQPCVTIQIAIS